LAVDSAHVYWTNHCSLGRADLNGMDVERSLIYDAGHTIRPTGGLAVDGAHIYWANFAGFQGPSAVGLANLNGNDVTPDFITAESGPGGVAVDRLLGGPPPTTPTSKAQCEHGGWKSFGGQFKNQGQCVRFVAHHDQKHPR
jgi:hypothetical protein